MKIWYQHLTSNKKCLFLLGSFDAIVMLCLIPFSFLTTSDGYWYGSLFIGWILGCIAQIAAYLSIVFTSNALTNPKDNSTAGALFGAGGFFVRFFLYGAVLVLSAISTFKSEWLGGFNVINFFSCCAALVVMSFFVMAFKFIEIRKEPDPIANEEKK